MTKSFVASRHIFFRGYKIRKGCLVSLWFSHQGAAEIFVRVETWKKGNLMAVKMFQSDKYGMSSAKLYALLESRNTQERFTTRQIIILILSLVGMTAAGALLTWYLWQGN